MANTNICGKISKKDTIMLTDSNSLKELQVFNKKQARYVSISIEIIKV